MCRGQQAFIGLVWAKTKLLTLRDVNDSLEHQRNGYQEDQSMVGELWRSPFRWPCSFGYKVAGAWFLSGFFRRGAPPRIVVWGRLGGGREASVEGVK